ncbi:MAG: carboxypeptidase regulatory-like domain-containing protein [Gemmatimonadota bacterium]|nr:carboxypeptidase regulatory-like domain-containing protein [Gemmatimonadota bacterium]
MSRLKLIATAALVAVLMANACGDETVQPAATGSIAGQVAIEGRGIDGVTVALGGGATTVTAGGGGYRFADVKAGDHTITISNYPAGAKFAASSASAELADAGEVVTVNFKGSWIRTSAITGAVTAENDGLGGVTVKISGVSESEMRTGADGAYVFTGLRAGDYTVEISGVDPGDVVFASTSASVALAVDESKPVDFEGTYVRTSSVMGQVGAEGSPLEGVTVSLAGRGHDLTKTTNGAGQYVFDSLRSGEYSVGISGYDTDQYGFATTSKTVSVAAGESAAVPFEGTALRTAAVMGAVTVQDAALEAVTVTLRGGGEERSAVTDAAGRYAFDRLHGGDYSVSISGYDAGEYGFGETSKSVTVALKETATVKFDGIMLRTAGISGRVSVAGSGLEGVKVALAGKEDRSGTTGDDGRFGFSGLAAGDYTLSISGYDEAEYDFDASLEITLALGESKIADFPGRSLRTAGVTGAVTAEGRGLEGVSVTLIEAGGADGSDVLETARTGSDGGYGFDGLLAGTYRVEIADFGDEYDFDRTSWTGTVATDETATADFSATVIRTASVSGSVSADGDGLAGVTVALGGDHAPEDNTVETDAGGGYAFDGLRKGAYTVTITNPDEDLYEFPATSRPVSLSVGQARDDVSFAGQRLRKAGIGGQVHVEGAGLEGVTVVLSGDADAEETTDADGEYDFPGLAGGDYSVEISGWDDVAYEFETTRLDIALGDDEAGIADFSGNHAATASISGALFLDEIEADGALADGEPNLRAEIPLLLRGPGDRDVARGMSNSDGAYSFDGLKAGSYSVLVAGSDSLTEALADAGYRFAGSDAGEVVDVAAAAAETVNFPFRITKQTILVGAAMGNENRVGDAIGGVLLALYPTAGDAAKGTNGLGTATTAASGDETGLATFEFAREDDADARVFAKVVDAGHADLVAADDNPFEIGYEAVDRVASVPAAIRLLNTRVNFQWWVKSDAGAKDGDRFLPGWTATDGTATDAEGRAAYSGSVDISDLPATFTVALDARADQPDMDERWEQSAALTHIHDGLSLPAANTAADNDLGAIRVTWLTQALVVGVYREADDAPGYTNFQSKLPGGDHRPVASVGEEMTVELLERDRDNRLRRYAYDHDGDPNTDDREGYATVGPHGLLRFARIPAGDEITIRFREGDERVQVGEIEDVETFGDDLDIGATVGAFGAMSGGVPEVRICSASEGTSDDECATFGYQWTTGSVSGRVGNASGHAVILEPTTDGHGAPGDSTTSGPKGAYGFTGLQDGEYAITASGTATRRVDGEATQSVWVYHDERTGEAGTDWARWTTTRIDLKIVGYVGNDADGDKLLRGDEAPAGVAVSLTRGSETVATVETDERGLYVFDNLEEGRYAVTASSGGDYVALRGFDPDTDAAIATATAYADDYPPLREGGHRLPSWDYASNRAVNTSVRVRKTGSTGIATLVNFALVYTDGALSGGVENVSGSAADIDLLVRRERDGQVAEITTDGRGRFEKGDLAEGSYRIEIADERFAAPCLAAANGTPDDDGPDADADGECDHVAATEANADLRGGEARADLPVLQVYDTKLSADDSIGDLPGIKARKQGRSSSYNDTVTWTPEWIRTPDSEETRSATPVGTISWASKSVTFSFPEDGSIPADASVAVRKDTTVCAGHTCELDYRATGTPGPSLSMETVLTVAVTAENGYDDHTYSVVVARANPVGNGLLSDRVRRRNADDTYTEADGFGTYDEPYELQTDSAEAGSLDLHVDLRHLGVPDDNAACAQSLVVKTTPDEEDSEAEEIEAGADAEGDICANERYTLSVAKGGSRYTLHVYSEDGVEKVHHLALGRGPEN